METVLELVERIAARLGKIEGVLAVALGGSWARGTASPNSDLDIGLYYDPVSSPSLDALQTAAREFDDAHRPDIMTGFGGWGPWINGGGWLKINGGQVDWLYRDTRQVRQVLEDCRAGKATCDMQPGYAHGFHNHIYLAETHYCKPLYDPAGALAALKALAETYPLPLKQTLLKDFMWQATFALDNGRKAITRNDSYYVGGCFFRAIACLVQVLFALNEQFFMNEKGSIRLAQSFPLCPPEFEQTVLGVMAHPGENPAQLQVSQSRLDLLAEQVQALVTGNL